LLFLIYKIKLISIEQVQVHLTDFVSSVEFCKFNFEGKSDNGTEIQGSPGPTLATVQQGSSGPQAIKGTRKCRANRSTMYSRTTRFSVDRYYSSKTS
jgi:hypothetical protein